MTADVRPQTVGAGMTAITHDISPAGTSSATEPRDEKLAALARLLAQSYANAPLFP